MNNHLKHNLMFVEYLEIIIKLYIFYYKIKKNYFRGYLNMNLIINIYIIH